MNIAKYAIKYRVVTYVLTVLMLGIGAISFRDMARLEDPEFTIKACLVITPYPGASATEVAEEVSEEMEKAVQKLGPLDYVESKSAPGLSTLTLEMKPTTPKESLPQVWDEVRRKVGDSQMYLPPGAGPSLVVDDFGDVYGIFLAIYGQEYTYAELKDHVKMLERELLLCTDVAKVSLYGMQPEVVFIDMNRDRMAELGIPTQAIVDLLTRRNMVADAGRVQVGPEFISLRPSGTFERVEDIESLLIRSGGNQQIYLKDVADVRRGYSDPAQNFIRFDGHPAIGLGVSTVSGGNVVTMGQAVSQRLEELKPMTPLGMEIGVVSFQSQSVTESISSFLINLGEAVAIVIVVLMIFMGLRSGLLIGFILLLTIMATFVLMAKNGVALERISLGALIIALGMLVDNAIVIVDGMLVRIGKGQKAEDAAIEVVKQTAIPLLGATCVAIAAFAAIGTSTDSTGEFCRSLYQVILYSLLLSWVTAVTVTPLLGIRFLKEPTAEELEKEKNKPEKTGGFMVWYESFLKLCLHRRWVVVGAVIALFLVGVWGFGYVQTAFFPDSTRPQFMVHYWLPQGTHIDTSAEMIAEVEAFVQEQDGVATVTSCVGQGPLRFMLTFTPEQANSAYSLLVIDVDDYTLVPELGRKIETWIGQNMPGAFAYYEKFQLGASLAAKIEGRFSGPDPAKLREISEEALEILYAQEGTKDIRTDWRQRVKAIRPVVAAQQANLNGITRADIAQVVQQAFSGTTVGAYRQKDELWPIILRASESERVDVNSLDNLQIWSPAAQGMIPLRQVVTSFETDFEDDLIMRRDRLPTITVMCNPTSGTASSLFKEVRPKLEAMELPPGYKFEWGGEFESSTRAQSALAENLPFFFGLMILLVIMLFNSLKEPLIIFLTVPLIIIGVTSGLLALDKPFGFMAILGFLSLTGMQIKNAVVLVDEINLQRKGDKEPFRAILDSAAGRLRPVSLAALTTMLGMLPLLMDAFFSSMAVTIVFGLAFATIFTMVIVPVFYAIVFKIREEHGTTS